MPTQELERSLAKYQGYVVGGLAFIVVFSVTMVSVMLWQAYRLGSEAQQVQNIAVTTHTSLCALRDDLQVRYNANQRILNTHKEEPIRIFGLKIPRATLIQSTQSQASTLKALEGLNC